MYKPETPKSMTDFHGGPPAGAFDDSKLTQDFPGKLIMVGGSNPDEGKGPYDTAANHADGSPFSQNDVWGTPTQNGLFGGNVL